MSLKYIDSEKLYYAFISGAKEVIKNKKQLNKINVFPVADGDTGTNLALTMSWIVKKSKLMHSVVDTFKSIADAALVGARGNSGTIFAQYINGITMEINEEKRLSLVGFSTSVRNGVTYAFDAVENPVDGTMLTVIKDWADSMYSLKDSAKDFIEILKLSIEEANISLNKTPDKIELLKRNGVVDSGAKGFVTFLKGFLSYLESGKIDKEITEEIGFEEIEHNHDFNHNEEIKYKYCTEGFIEGKKIDVKKLKEELKDLGDSLIVAGNNGKVRVHLHTNNPELLFKRLSKYGDIIEQKAENMRLQQDIVKNRKYKIALVTDSIADISQEIVDKYQIYQVPLNLNIGKSAYLDKVTVTSKEVYEILKGTKERAVSSQPSIKAVEGIYSYLSTYYDSIIVVTVSKEMSGTYNVFNKAAERFNNDIKRITVINSKSNSAAEGLIVLKAAEAIHKGLDYDSIIEEIKSTVEKSKIYVSISNLKGMVRSGRVSTVLGTVGTIVNLKPIISIDSEGKGVAIGKAFSINENTKEIYNMVKDIKEKDGIASYSIVHGRGYDRIDEFYLGIKEIIGKDAEYISEISSIVASSAGENCIAIGLIKE